MSYAYNKHKEGRRHSKPKHGHTLRGGQHKRRLTPTQMLRVLLKRQQTRGE